MMFAVETSGLTRCFGAVRAVDGLDLRIEAGRDSLPSYVVFRGNDLGAGRQARQAFAEQCRRFHEQAGAALGRHVCIDYHNSIREFASCEALILRGVLAAGAPVYGRNTILPCRPFHSVAGHRSRSCVTPHLSVHPART